MVETTNMDIKTIMKERGITQEELAMRLAQRETERTGIEKKPINRSGLSQTINGNPSVSKLEEIASAIGCKVGDFFRNEITPSAPSEISITINGQQYIYQIKQ